MAAPSSYNIQDWQIVIIQDEAQKAALSAASWNQQQIIQAPVTFVFAADATAGEKDLTPILERGLQTGAWNSKAVQMTAVIAKLISRSVIVNFQKQGI